MKLRTWGNCVGRHAVRSLDPAAIVAPKATAVENLLSKMDATGTTELTSIITSASKDLSTFQKRVKRLLLHNRRVKLFLLFAKV